MPHLTCTDCQRKMTIATNSVRVITMFNEPPEPYQIWNADLWQCPECSHEVLAGYAEMPVAEHWHDDFDDIYDEVIHDGKRPIYYERER